ncbi:DUF659 domain-containing protein [Aphis craccivora]|uniref:DUF659 domain-containing protein n=1 Tax=Aphis craccivora TaxID=307492 RepID=A0A6G0VVW6_APHCR|nr:DUF659 domain-containing protein [Aphis craccivora]
MAGRKPALPASVIIDAVLNRSIDTVRNGCQYNVQASQRPVCNLINRHHGRRRMTIRFCQLSHQCPKGQAGREDRSRRTSTGRRRSSGQCCQTYEN